MENKNRLIKIRNNIMVLHAISILLSSLIGIAFYCWSVKELSFKDLGVLLLMIHSFPFQFIIVLSNETMSNGIIYFANQTGKRLIKDF